MVIVHDSTFLYLETALEETFSLQQPTVLRAQLVWHGFAPAQLPDDLVTSLSQISLLLLACHQQYYWSQYALLLVSDQPALYQKPTCNILSYVHSATFTHKEQILT